MSIVEALEKAVSKSNHEEMKRAGVPPFVDGRYAITMSKAAAANLVLQKQEMPYFLNNVAKRNKWKYLGQTQYFHVFEG